MQVQNARQKLSLQQQSQERHEFLMSQYVMFWALADLASPDIFEEEVPTVNLALYINHIRDVFPSYLRSLRGPKGVS